MRKPTMRSGCVGCNRLMWISAVRILGVGRSFTWVMMSPRRRPAKAAGPLRKTAVAKTPWAASKFRRAAMSGVRSMPSMPNQPRITRPCCTNEMNTVWARSAGIAKPMPCEPPERLKMAVLMPINSPWVFTRTPPKLPGLMEASV